MSGVRIASSVAVELVIDNVSDGDPRDGDIMAVDSAKGRIIPDGDSSVASCFFQNGDPSVALKESEALLRTSLTSFISGETKVAGRPIVPP